MDYYFGFAGIPREIRDRVEAKNAEYAKGAGFCIDTMPSYVPYSQRNIKFFLDRFEQQLTQNAKVKETSFAIIYLVRDPASTEFFTDAFFPHTLMVPVVWQWDAAQMTSLARVANELVEKLKQATALVRSALPTLKDELQSRASSTAALLPIRNFKSDIYVGALKVLHQELASGVVAREAVVRHNRDVIRAHPMKMIEGRQRSCFVDDQGVEFHPPGNDRHGFARAGGDHQLHCLLAGKRRLGAPYDPLFHYDCTKGNRNLKGSFFGCHLPAQRFEGNPHLNIAPNDHVRG
ncbi:hypothetical protein [Pseudomonas sp. NPDC088444]|uniref:hypothetical protein n=1 Tax=Pseudomonas sp. NPDC088444 TaxID=3364456 RepID=UPI0038506A8C